MRVLHKEIAVRFEFVGQHQWIDAPSKRAYLAQMHRHKFFCCVTIPVSHSNRQVEFHDLLDLVQSATPSDVYGMSCEMIAEEIASVVLAKYGNSVKVEVWEDNECGGIVCCEED